MHARAPTRTRNEVSSTAASSSNVTDAVATSQLLRSHESSGKRLTVLAESIIQALVQPDWPGK